MQMYHTVSTFGDMGLSENRGYPQIAILMGNMVIIHWNMRYTIFRQTHFQAWISWRHSNVVKNVKTWHACFRSNAGNACLCTADRDLSFASERTWRSVSVKHLWGSLGTRPVLSRANVFQPRKEGDRWISIDVAPSRDEAKVATPSNWLEGFGATNC